HEAIAAGCRAAPRTTNRCQHRKRHKNGPRKEPQCKCQPEREERHGYGVLGQLATEEREQMLVHDVVPDEAAMFEAHDDIPGSREQKEYPPGARMKERREQVESPLDDDHYATNQSRQ